MANIELDGANKKIKVDSGDLTLDVPGDIVLDADGGDVVFADGGTNLLKVTNSSSDVVLQPQVDTKDIVFKQYDGTVVATVEDNATFNIPASKLAIGGTAVTSTAAELNIVDGNTSATSTTIADADRVVLNDNGTMVQAAVTDLKTYIGGFDVSSITGATALAAQPAATDEIVLSDAGTLKRLDIKHISNTPAFSVKQSGNQAIANQTETKVEFATEVFDSDGVFASHKFTPVIPGKYFLKAQVLIEYGNSAGEYGDLAIFKNGTKEIAARNNKTGDPTRSDSLQVSGIVTADSNDYFEIYVWHNQGASQNTDSNDDYTRFEGFRLTGMES